MYCCGLIMPGTIIKIIKMHEPKNLKQQIFQLKLIIAHHNEEPLNRCHWGLEGSVD